MLALIPHERSYKQQFKIKANGSIDRDRKTASRLSRMSNMESPDSRLSNNARYRVLLLKLLLYVYVTLTNKTNALSHAE